MDTTESWNGEIDAEQIRQAAAATCLSINEAAEALSDLARLAAVGSEIMQEFQQETQRRRQRWGA